ncbi:MAG: hypothetical protein FWD48_07305 [Oscillospiraceae bacterium]|nr:hypothetical protein [Oscillospiraceae bacterium]
MRPSPLFDNRVQRTPKPVNLESTLDYMQQEIERLKTILIAKNSTIAELQNESEKQNLRIEELETTIDEVIMEKHELLYALDLKSQRSFNERGAGRKSKITTEIENYVIGLRQRGNSFAEISKICVENDIVISKSTVDRIIRKWISSQN